MEVNVDISGRVMAANDPQSAILFMIYQTKADEKNLLVTFNVMGANRHGVVPAEKFEGFTKEEIKKLSAEGGEVEIRVPITDIGPGFISKVSKAPGVVY